MKYDKNLYTPLTEEKDEFRSKEVLFEIIKQKIVVG